MPKRYPLIEEVRTPLPAPQLFALFEGRPFSFYLDSGMDPGKLGRYSLMGSDPFLVLKSRGREITFVEEGKLRKENGDPFTVLGELLGAYALEKPGPDVPFPGGVVGYFSYDLCHFIERLPAAAADDLGLPECYLGFYDAVVAFDHLLGKTYIISTGFPEQDEMPRTKRAGERLREIRGLIAEERCVAERPSAAGLNEATALSSNFSRQGYLEAVARAREYICAGDIFQVNLSQRFEVALSVPPYALYRRLRHINPAPFAAYLDFDEVRVISASPERFLKVRSDFVETRPIKGTRPRGRTPAEDEALAGELLSSAKDRAENVMIVDLERNDIGRVCRYGSVRVTELVILETYPTVFHLTSTVVGRLRPGIDRVDLLRAAFPGGSITGAPKVRAMEIIDELEPTRRGVYTGSIGYLGFDGDMDLNIVIRTILAKGGRAYFQVGGGIVYDSEPEAEYRETLDKARALARALGLPTQVSVEATP